MAETALLEVTSLPAKLRPARVIPERAEEPAAGPIVKWVGGKTKLLDDLERLAPRTYRRYFEPFLGGAALFFRMAPKAAFLSDVNADLIDCYRAVRGDVEGVIRSLRRHRALHSEAYFYQVREAWNAGRARTAVDRAASFLYLNKTCYNGLWRVNSKGEFNVPAGRYTNPTIVDEDGLRTAALALGKASLESVPFERVLDQAQSGDFVYFDPPYYPLSETSAFTSYTANRFSGEDQARLADVFRQLDARGCAVMLSNSDTPFIRNLFRGFRIARVMCARAINSRADGRGAVAEVVVTNRY
jgi:DNA adenine methylase